MSYRISENAKKLNERLEVFMDQHIYPHEKDYDEFTLIKIIFGNIQSGMKV